MDELDFEQFCALVNQLEPNKHVLKILRARFAALDTCDSWEEAVAGRQFRIKDVVDPTSGAKLLELEHETRSVRHFQYMKDVAWSA